MSTEKMETLRQIRSGLIETMRRIEQKGHENLLNGEWRELLAKNPAKAIGQGQFGRGSSGLGQSGLGQDVQEVKNKENTDSTGSMDRIEPLLSKGPSRIRLVGSATSEVSISPRTSWIADVDVKDPKEFETILSGLDSITNVCGSFDSVLSHVFPLSETCIDRGNQEPDQVPKPEKAKPGHEVINLLDLFTEAIGAESTSTDSVQTWLSWLPVPFIEHLDGSLLGSKTSLPSMVTTSTASLPISAVTQCDCRVCQYVNTFIQASQMSLNEEQDCSCVVDQWNSSLNLGSSKDSCKTDLSSHLGTNDPKKADQFFESDTSAGSGLTMESLGFSDPNPRKRPFAATRSSICSCKTDATRETTTSAIRSASKEHVEQFSPRLLACPSTCSCTAVWKKPKINEEKSPSNTKSSTSVCPLGCSWYGEDVPAALPLLANKCSSHDMPKNHPSLVSQESRTSGYEADNEASLARLHACCPPSFAVVDRLEMMPSTSKDFPSPPPSTTTTSIQVANTDHADKISMEIDLETRRFLEHKKAAWLMYLIICDTGIRVADEALKQFDKNNGQDDDVDDADC